VQLRLDLHVTHASVGLRLAHPQHAAAKIRISPVQPEQLADS
jgi:hypothetical protein